MKWRIVSPLSCLSIDDRCATGFHRWRAGGAAPRRRAAAGRQAVADGRPRRVARRRCRVPRRTRRSPRSPRGIDAGRLWTSPLIGPPASSTAASPTTLRDRHGCRTLHDPLHGLPGGQPVGLIVMDFAARRRLRINGTLSAAGDGGFEVDVVQAYGNCPQYIHPRRPRAAMNRHARRDLIRRGDALAARGRRRRCSAADTFFLGTTHPEFGNDASHRGGPAGFVRADATLRVVAGLPRQQHVQQPGKHRGRSRRPRCCSSTSPLGAPSAVRSGGGAWLDDERAVRFVCAGRGGQRRHRRCVVG